MQREITRELVRRLLPGRMAESNKGSYGSVLAAAGSMAYRGAAALCTEGALRGGAGLVYLASVEPVIQLVLSRTPESCGGQTPETTIWWATSTRRGAAGSQTASAAPTAES